MRPSKIRFVTACQQFLALGAVLAVLTPAAAVISLDVVRETPHGELAVPSGRPAAELSAYSREAARRTKVPAGPVDADVREYPLTAPTGQKSAVLGLQARTKIGALDETSTVTSVPEPVVGYGAVGVTWDRGREFPTETLSFETRTRTGDTWSDWMELPYDDDHGPDPDAQEAEGARPGTDVLLVGKVDEVQVRSTTTKRVPPAGMRMAVVAPGTPTRTARELPALDTAEGSTTGGEPVPEDPGTPDPGTPEDPDAGIDLQAATYTAKPVIYSRKQWGANESLRDKSSLHYYEVHAGFVHHTVNANNYSRSEVPGILRSIYAYHTQSRGWSDVGYNFLVDRFGRIWEGRAGGIDRPVVGAHTLGYNEYAFAMSAIGNFETTQPSQAMLEAYGALFAWKLSLHGVDASSTKQWVGSKNFEAINGHRDAASTACPGRNLYAKIPQIREYAAAAQKGWAGRELESNLASTPHPDLIVRRARDGQAFIIPTGGLIGFKRPVKIAGGATDAATMSLSPDLTGDGKADLLVQGTDGTTRLYPGSLNGFGDRVGLPGMRGRDLITPVGDLNGDGLNDIVTRKKRNGRMHVFLGTADGGFDRKRQLGDWSAYDALAATGDVNGDGHVDLFARDRDGKLWLHPGTSSRQFGTPVQVPGNWGGYESITGFGDYSGDGVGDLVVRRAGEPGEVLPSRGNGTFGHSLGLIKRVQRGTDLTGADLDGDGSADLMLRRGDEIRLYANKGTFATGAPIPTGINLTKMNAVLNAGDWDRDGHGDVITRKRNGALHLWRGDGEGGFSDPTRLSRKFDGVGLLAAVGDMTGDGWPDLMGQPSGGAMRIYPGRGLDGVRKGYVAHSRISAGRQVPIGRWDRDGAPDILFRDGNRLTLFPGNGPGGLTDPQKLGISLKDYDWVVGISDARLTGHGDMIVRKKGTGELYLIEATAKGFKAPRFIGEGAGEYDLVG